MSRILIHSNAPWVPSGYGKQTAHLVRTLQSPGHEVVVSAFCGLTGSPIDWQGTTVLPSGQYEYGVDVLPSHLQFVKPDLTILLMDIWKLGPIGEQLAGHNVAAWVPVDCTPLSRLDGQFLKQFGVRPIAMSRFGEEQLAEAGLRPLYAPHVVDRQIFQPLEADKRADYREQMGIDGRFVIGICAANNDATRKGFPEQFAAFQQFHAKHPEAMLWVHSIPKAARGLDLQRLAAEMGIDHTAMRWTDVYPQVAGMFDDSLMADWYGVLDVLSACSYAEAFGVPLIEAQACGTPVITTRGSAMMETKGSGWSVIGERYWNPVHGAWWTRPRIDAITRAYGKALGVAHVYREAAEKFASAYDSRDTAEAHWKGIVEALVEGAQ